MAAVGNFVAAFFAKGTLVDAVLVVEELVDVDTAAEAEKRAK